MYKKITQKNKTKDLYIRFSFLIPILLGIIFSYLVHDTIWENQRSSAVAIIICIIVFTIIVTHRVWSKYCDNSKKDELQKRREFTQDMIIFQMGNIIFLTLMAGLIFIFAFFYQILAYHNLFLSLLIIGILLCFCSYRIFRNIEKNYKKYFSILAVFFILLLSCLLFFYNY